MGYELPSFPRNCEAGLPIGLPPQFPIATYSITCSSVAARDELQPFLQKIGIAPTLYYAVPIHSAGLVRRPRT